MGEVFSMAVREFVLYRGEKFWLQTSGRYFQSGRKDASERLLHRRIWIDNFGEIPSGYEVHHKDYNWRESSPENLELLEGSYHSRMHMLRRNATAGGLRATHNALASARPKAAEWHKSTAGRKWHSENAQKLWDKREPITLICRK